MIQVSSSVLSDIVNNSVVHSGPCETLLTSDCPEMFPINCDNMNSCLSSITLDV